MLEIKPCQKCGELEHVYVERLMFRYSDIAVVQCQNCMRTEAAPGLPYGCESWADEAIRRWNLKPEVADVKVDLYLSTLLTGARLVQARIGDDVVAQTRVD